ncbi:hypothetical protein [Mycolicibacterium wolinskyi]|uniref:hypothetical protein n=1 Tax=Mycolicibacterium wolinskyi TaxID=59750 RepID=UPI0039177DF7
MLFDYWALREVFLHMQSPVLARARHRPASFKILGLDHHRLISTATERCHHHDHFAKFQTICVQESTPVGIFAAQLFSIKSLSRVGIEVEYADVPNHIMRFVMNLSVRFRITPREALGVTVALHDKLTYVVRDIYHISGQLFNSLDFLEREHGLEWDFINEINPHG